MTIRVAQSCALEYITVSNRISSSTNQMGAPHVYSYFDERESLRPKWLDRDAVLRGWGETAAERRAAYACFVDAGLVEDISDPAEAEAAAAGALIGGDRFIDRMRRALTDLSENVNVRRESAQHRQLASWCAVERVVAAVAREYSCDEEGLLRRYNRGCEARQALLGLIGYLIGIRGLGVHEIAQSGGAFGVALLPSPDFDGKSTVLWLVYNGNGIYIALDYSWQESLVCLLFNGCEFEMVM